MNKNDKIAVAKQKLDAMPSATLDTILSELWETDLSAYVQTDADKLKLVMKGVIALKRNNETALAGLRRANREISRLSNAPKLF